MKPGEFLDCATRLAQGAADYDLQIVITQIQAHEAVKRAHAVVADFQKLLQTIGPAQIIAGARQHLQAIGKLGKIP